MEKNSISKIVIAAMRSIVLTCLMVSASLTWADDKDRPCSKYTLFGVYGTDAHGLLLPAPGPSLEFQGLSVTNFDGRGGLTWAEYTVVNGNPVHPGWVRASGTYSVNPDCTATAVVNTPFSPVPLKFFLVVVKHGKEVHGVLNSDALAISFTKVEAHFDW
jgi:hypothetical protein